MKEVKVLSMDNRGRILIPLSIRKAVGFSTESKFMLVADTERKEVKITSLGLADAQNPMKIKISMRDAPGALGKIASTLGDLGISILYSEGGVLEKDKSAFYVALIQSENYHFDKIKEILINESAALDVEELPLE